MTTARATLACVRWRNSKLQSCVEDGKEPDTPFKGVFNVRLDPELGTGKRSH
ncbi:toxin-antitoxin system HicB family antitoxin [Escherichia coli]|nr:toxin-antitoxin system HicB family antitoxin [Escherichia coli]EFP7154096.1 toxin-antitoxin system HicB family antitoxin [Shigella flexneri]EFX5107208.1 toxin-antitoxin system HicB family antitoxin [Shigella sonnei]EEC8422924.1 toxin-antitoxin system HicB family antitoxin [Escherichia coli]EEQ3553165.1 toxin-antitoxin system HicB family antitoxin [Escherichia coli]